MFLCFCFLSLQVQEYHPAMDWLSSSWRVVWWGMPCYNLRNWHGLHPGLSLSLTHSLFFCLLSKRMRKKMPVLLPAPLPAPRPPLTPYTSLHHIADSTVAPPSCPSHYCSCTQHIVIGQCKHQSHLKLSDYLLYRRHPDTTWGATLLCDNWTLYLVG